MLNSKKKGYVKKKKYPFSLVAMPAREEWKTPGLRQVRYCLG